MRQDLLAKCVLAVVVTTAVLAGCGGNGGGGGGGNAGGGGGTVTPPADKPFMLSPEGAAQRIKAGLAKNQARISFPFPLSFGMWLLAVLPAAWSQWLLRVLGFAGRR